jgi:hypothetical protein
MSQFKNGSKMDTHRFIDGQEGVNVDKCGHPEKINLNTHRRKRGERSFEND